jgi:hypothetical protein
MQRRQVVRRAADLRLAQRGDDRVAVGRTADEQVVDVSGLVLGRRHEVAEPEVAVALGRLAAQARPVVEVPQEDAQHRGLDLVEPRVVADVVEVDLVARAVEPEPADAFAELRIVGRDEAAVAEGEEVLGRIEAVRRGDARLPDTRRAEGLSGVLDERRPERRKLGERGRPAEEMHGHDRARAACDARGDVLRVEVARRRIDVREDGDGAAAHDRLGGRVEGERGADHLVAGADPERVEHEDERVGAVRDADRLAHAQVLGGLTLERRHVRAEDEDARIDDLGEDALQLRDQRRVLRLDVNEGDPGHG